MSDRFDFNKWLAEAAEQMDMNGNLYLDGDGKVLDAEKVTVVKSSAYLPISFEHLIDSGAMTEEEARARGWEPTVYPPTPWHRKLRWRISDRIAVWRDALALRLYRLVAGHDPEVDCDC